MPDNTKTKQNEKKERKAILKKKNQVQKIYQELKEAKSLVLVDLRNLPDRILQKTRKDFRNSIKILIGKKAVLTRALQMAKINLDTRLNFPSALIISKTLSPYGIAKLLKKSKEKVFAKPNQIAPEDIIVPEGETDLPPGPALAELKNAKINAAIKGGKIVVQKDSLVVKKGEVISDLVAKALQKLGIKPFEISIKILQGNENNIIYSKDILDLDEQKLKEELITSEAIATNMSINLSYPTQKNIQILLANSYAQSVSLATIAGVYSPAHVNMLLASAIRQANILMGKTNINNN